MKHFQVLIVIFCLLACLSACSIASQVDPLKARKTVDQLLIAARDSMRLNSEESRATARAQLELAYSLLPAAPEVLDALGCLEWQAGRIDLAEMWFHRALLQDPTYDAAYVNLAVIVEGRGDPNQARELLRRAIQMNPLNYRARNNYAGLLYDYASSAHQEAVAYRELLKAIESAPNLDNTLRYNLKKFKSSNTLSSVNP